MRQRWLIGAAAMLVIAASADARESKARPPQVVHPEQWLGPENYPPRALRNNEEGRVVVQVAVDAIGRPTDCRVTQPIGSESLEQGTCQAAMTRGQFLPATDRKGRPVAGTLTMPVRWVLPTSLPGQPDSTVVGTGQSDFQTITSYTADGGIISCTISMNGTSIPTTAATCPSIGLDLNKLRATTHVTGPFRLGMTVSVRHGDDPPALPGPALGGRELMTIVSRQSIAADGTPSDCKVTASGEIVDPARAAAANFCVKPADHGKIAESPFAGGARQLLFVSRLYLLPPAN